MLVLPAGPRVASLLASLGLALTVGAQASVPTFTDPEAQDASRATVRISVEGAVQTQEGWPAAGVLVTSSAGGETRTRADGSFRLELEVAEEAESVVLQAEPAGDRAGLVRSTVSLNRRAGASAAGLLTLGSSACEPSWVPTFGGRTGTEDDILEMIVMDDGSGPALYVSGKFHHAGGYEAERIARWDGTTWSALGQGVQGPLHYSVRALEVFEEPSGTALFMSGLGIQPSRWDGTSWTTLGSDWVGPGAPINPFADDLEVYDDGSGPALYAAGLFLSIGGAPDTIGIARWNGSSWSTVGGSLQTYVSVTNDIVRKLRTFDDGSGPALYAIGRFSSIGGTACNGFARWNGTSWQALSPTLPDIADTAVFDDGSGPALYLAVPNGVARWDGVGLQPLGSGMNGIVTALAVFDSGSGSELYACGSFTLAGGVPVSRIAKWNGTNWSAVGGSTVNGVLYAMTPFDDGSGPALFAGGHLELDFPVGNLSKWNGSLWSTIAPLEALSGEVRALTSYDDGSGPALCAGGRFQYAGTAEARNIVLRRGTGWETLTGGLYVYGSTTAAHVDTLCVLDGTSGTDLYASGFFHQAGPVTMFNAARWDGTGWNGLQTYNPALKAMVVFDDGTGPALYGGGSGLTFGALVQDVAKWNGVSWVSLGGPFSGSLGEVYALAVFDDGSGPALYAGGNFMDAGGVPANSVARWNGNGWQPLGDGITDVLTSNIGSVYSLMVFDDGNGPALYVGGAFDTAGGLTARNLAKWDGTSWLPVADLNGPVHAMALFDDGGGPALHVGGSFTTADGMAVRNLAKRQGGAWLPLGGGTNGPVLALLPWHDASGSALIAGGSFLAAPDSGDCFLARWQGCDFGAPLLDCPDAIEAYTASSGRVVTFDVTATDAIDPAPELVVVPPSGSHFPLGKTLVHCTATDAYGNVSSCEFPVTVSRRVRPR